MLEPSVHVAVAVIRNVKNEVLIAKRPDHVHQGGLWEFPGGKLESGEDVGTALHRELLEELGIKINQTAPLIILHHHYSDKLVFLDVHCVTDFSGEPVGMEGQRIKWVPINNLQEYSFPQANKSIINCLQLPDCYMITGDYDSTNQFNQKLIRAINNGVRLVQFRNHNLSDITYIQQAKEAQSLCLKYNVKLFVNSRNDSSNEINAAGIHFTSEQLLEADIKSMQMNKLCSASVHNQAQLDRANNLHMDFIVISPVLPTTSHPDSMPLGWDKLRALIQRANMPVYALGGMKTEHLHHAIEAGAQGIAAIGNLWDRK